VVKQGEGLRDKPGAWVDLGLTLPLFLVYHLGVVFLGVKNGTDFITDVLLHLAEGSREAYLGITGAIGLAFAIPFVLLARGQVFRPQKFFQIAVEGGVYAILMGLTVPRLVGYLFARAGVEEQGRAAGLIMSCGAGFYEELSFRVVLFGLGGKALVWAFAQQKVSVLEGSEVKGKVSLRTVTTLIGWAIVCAAAFSGVHYVGAFGDSFAMPSFAARAMLGLLLTLIFVTRGFAAAVWAHALYDVWVLVVRV
jgi:hypothetical protein